MSAFWERAKQDDILKAVYDLTRADKREEKPPRYKLNADARKAAWQVLGPPPEHPEHSGWHKPPAKEQGQEAAAKPKRTRGRGR